MEIRDKITSGKDNVYVGEYLGFQVHMSYGATNKEYYLTLKNKDESGQSHSVSLGTDAYGCITRIDNVLNKIEAKLESAKLCLEEYKSELAQCETALMVPFNAENELKEGLERLSVLNIKLNLEHKRGENTMSAETDTKEEIKGISKRRDFSR